MDFLISLSSSNVDFAEIDTIFGSLSLISVVRGDGILLAANQRILLSQDLKPEIVGKHVDEIFDGYCFEHMSRRTFEKVLNTGIPLTFDRVYRHRYRVLERIHTLMLRIPWESEFAVLCISHEVTGFLVDSLRNYNPKTKTIPGIISGLPMRWVDFEMLYLALRHSSTKDIASVIKRSDDAVRLRLRALADYLEKTFSALGYAVSISPTLKGMQPFLRHWPINDAVLAGCITELNAWYGKDVISIAGLDAERKMEEVYRYDNLIKVSVAQIKENLEKEING
ncbi:MAG TPA: hypothetical protein VFM32_07630 [Spongiibacteraceae bacterium]|nr:hypothetical protein [Spongiibacteraceae bacterium]